MIQFTGYEKTYTQAFDSLAEIFIKRWIWVFCHVIRL